MPKLLNKVNLPQYASAPSSPVQGDMYYNTTDDTVYVYDGASWLDLAAGGGGSGDITAVVAGDGLTGGATVGSATLNVGAGTGISVSADAVSIDSSVVTIDGSQTLTNKSLTLPAINNIKYGYSTTVTSGGTTTLTSSSNYYQFFTGTSSHTVTLPVASTMTLGQSFQIHSLVTGGAIIINSSGNNFVANVWDNTSVLITCISSSGTSATSWDVRYLGTTTLEGSGPIVARNYPTIVGADLYVSQLRGGTAIEVFEDVTSGSSTSLTNFDASVQRWSGSANHTVVLPSSLSFYNVFYLIENVGTGTLTVNASGGQNVASVGPGQSAIFISLDNHPTTANLWSVRWVGGSTATGTGALVYGSSPTLTTPNLGTPSALTLTNATGLPISGITSSTSAAIGVGSIELGHATDTTITRSAAGTVAVEGVDLVKTTDSRLSDSRTPTAHASSHGSAGSDAITISASQVTGTAITAADTGTVTSAMIADGAIVNADINASAAIALSKLATDPLARANHTGTQAASTISDFDTQVRTSKVTDLAAPTSSFSMNSQKITSLGTPSADADAATKAYVDGVAQGLDIKASVRAATTAPITLSGTQTIDGVSLLANDRVLVKDQSSAVDNGIYVVSASTWSRADDAAQNGEITPGTFVFVEEGTANADSGWVMTSNGTITIGATAMAWSQFSGAGQITAGAGLTKSGNTLDVGAGTGISVAADSVAINTTVVPTISGANTVTFTAGATTALTLPASGTVATTSNKLSAFASTTSAELVSVISDAVGTSGKLVFNSNPTILIPNIYQLYASGMAWNTTSIATSGGSTTISWANYQGPIVRCTGSSNHTLVLAAQQSGAVFIIFNDGSGTITVNSSGSNLISTLSAGQAAQFLCTTSFGTTAASWSVNFLGGSTAGITASSTDTLTNKTISASSNTISGVAKVYYQATQPTGGTYAEGDIWIDSDDDTVTATGPQGPAGATGATGATGPAGDPTLVIPTPYKTSTYTFASGDESELIVFNSASALVAQIPTDATFNFAIGTQINILRYGTGALSVAAVTPATTTVRATPGANLRAQYSTATCIKLAANEWLVVGDLA